MQVIMNVLNYFKIVEESFIWNIEEADNIFHPLMSSLKAIESEYAKVNFYIK